ncbi:MAG: putative Cupredoxin [Candidatus Eremiobacteraeota bacterium]|nr:putative Cupredoxin [Candidatus Eremiobacteraeota bacterium]
MRRLILSLIVAMALGGAIAVVPVLGGNSAFAQTAAPSPAPVPSASAAASPAPAAVTVVHIKNFKYVPDTVTIHPGGAVKFIEDDDTPHTVTASDRSYDSGNLDKGQSWTHTFAKEGTYKYFCAYHTYMTGTITVK